LTDEHNISAISLAQVGIKMDCEISWRELLWKTLTTHP